MKLFFLVSILICLGCEFIETPQTICSTNMNVSGHVSFTELPNNKTVNLVVEYSFDDFNSFHFGASYQNPLDLLSIPFDITESVRSFCPLFAGQEIQVRAYLDANANKVWDSGEIGGRDDGTFDGNSSFLRHTVAPKQVFLKLDTEIFLDMQSP